MAQADDFLLGRSQSFPLGATAENRTDLALSQSTAQTGKVRGKVTNSIDGSAVANATIKIRTQSGDPVAHTDTNAGGNYILEGLAPGAYTINAALEGFVTPNGQTFSIQGGQTFDIDFTMTPESRPLNHIFGSVTNQATGERIVNARVVMVETTPSTGYVTVALSDSNGQYEICEIPNGTYSITVSQNGFQPSSLLPITVSGDSMIHAEVVLEPVVVSQATVHGFIQEQKGTPIANACVGLYLLDANGLENLQQVTYTDTRGFYIFSRATAGNYVVKARLKKVV